MCVVAAALYNVDCPAPCGLSTRYTSQSHQLLGSCLVKVAPHTAVALRATSRFVTPPRRGGKPGQTPKPAASPVLSDSSAAGQATDANVRSPSWHACSSVCGCICGGLYLCVAVWLCGCVAVWLLLWLIYSCTMGQGKTLVHQLSVGAGLQHKMSKDASMQLRVETGTGLSIGYALQREGLSISAAVHRRLPGVDAWVTGVGGAREGPTRPPVTMSLGVKITDALLRGGGSGSDGGKAAAGGRKSTTETAAEAAG